MDEMIGYCGYRCHLCAARSEDAEIRQKLVDGWRKYFGHEAYTAENVKCGGCKGEGPVADKVCRARPCAVEKGVESCALCDDFPCDKMKHLMASRPGLAIYLRSAVANMTKEEFDLCMRQFDSMPTLVDILIKAGKVPAFFAEEE